MQGRARTGFGFLAGRTRAIWLAPLLAFAVWALAAATAHAGAVSWSAPVPIGHGSAFNGISCPTATFCAAIDAYGEVVTATDPTGGSGAWTTTSLVNPGFADAGLDAISCPTISLCVVTDGLDGSIYASTDPTGGAGAWVHTVVDPGNVLNGVTCTTTSLCVAVDSSGDVLTSTDPTGGPGAWQTATVDGGNSLNGVACAGSGLCVAVGTGFSTSTDPTGGSGAWTTTTSLSASAVDCPSAGLCVAVDDSGNAYVSADPTGGPSAWRTVDAIDRLHPLQPMTGVSCPSAGLCVAVGESGDAAVTGEPLGGASAWSGASIDSVGLGGVSCPTTSLCVAVDDSGDALVGTVLTPSVAIQGVAEVVRGGRTALTLGCAGAPGGCGGVVVLTSTVRHRVVRRFRGRRRTVVVTRTVTLARARYRIHAGRATVRLRLTAVGLRLLESARAHRIRALVRTTITGAGPVRRVLILRLR